MLTTPSCGKLSTLESPEATPQALAEAMCNGLEHRWLTPEPPACQDFPAGIRKDTRRKLLHCGDLLNHPPTVKPGRFAPIVRLLRGALRVLLRPWLEMQTRCNAHSDRGPGSTASRLVSRASRPSTNSLRKLPCPL